jgi:hypothetical protein
MQQALEALEQLVPDDLKPYHKEAYNAITALRHAIEQAEAVEPVAHAIIAGALFDFMGYLTSRTERIVLSASDDAAPAVDAIRDFAKKRNLSLDDALVREWIDALPIPPTAPAQPEQEPSQWRDMVVHQCPSCGGFCKKPGCERDQALTDLVRCEKGRDAIAKRAQALQDVNADLRAKLAERSAEHLAAHITYDKGYQAGRDDTKDAEDEFNRGIEACMSRLYEMHRITTGRHNFYQHAALELAKLKEAS